MMKIDIEEPTCNNPLARVGEKELCNLCGSMEDLEEQDCIKKNRRMKEVKRTFTGRVRVNSREAIDTPKNLESSLLKEGSGGPTIDVNFVKQYFETFKKEFQNTQNSENSGYEKSLAIKIVKKATEIFEKEKSLQKLSTPTNGKIVIVGNLHGNLCDLISILDKPGFFPSEEVSYLFNGSMINKGINGPKVLLFIYALKVVFPNNVFINRGKHERRQLCNIYGFKGQILKNYDMTFYNLVINSFRYLPLCSVIDEKVFVVHGGLPNDTNVTLEILAKLPRFDSTKKDKENSKVQHVRRNSGLLTDSQMIRDSLLIGDVDVTGRITKIEPYHLAFKFGKDHVDSFLAKNNLELIIQSNHLEYSGFGAYCSDKLLSVFSSSYLSGTQSNQGAVLVHNHGTKWSREELEVHPNIGNNKAITGVDEQKNYAISLAAEKIYSCAHELQLKFEAENIEKKSGKVSKAVWEKVLSDIVPNSEVLELLFPPKDESTKENKKINYLEFLAQFHLKLEDKLTEWRKDAVKAFVATIVSKEKTLVSAFKEYDVGEDGLLSFAEFWEAMNKSKVDITKRQCHDIMQFMDENKDGYIDFPEFRSKFIDSFNEFNKTSELIKSSVTAISREMILKHGSIDEAFTKFDKNNDQQITYREFAHNLKKDLSAVDIDSELRKKIFGYVSKGKILKEEDFKIAFKPSKNGRRKIKFEPSVNSLIVDQLCETVRRYKTVFSDLWSETEVEGQISRDEFKQAFASLNVHLEEYPDLDLPKTNESQVLELYDLLKEEKDDWIDYGKLFEMFVVHYESDKIKK